MALRVKYDRNGYAEIVGDAGPSSTAGRPRHGRRRRRSGIGAAVVQKVSAPRSTGSVPFTKVSCVGLVFDKGLSTGSFTDPIPTKYRVVVYQLMQNRAVFGEGSKFWQKDADFVEDTERQAADKARSYIAKQGWTLASFSDYTARPT